MDVDTQHPKTPRKKSKKNKDVVRSAAVVLDEGDNVDNLSYKIPSGAELLDHDVDAGDFDFDSIKDNDDLEPWIIRLPQGVQAKHLDGLKLSLGSATQNEPLGSFTKKRQNYEVWSLSHEDEPDASQTIPVGGEEMLDFQCLLPRKNKEALYRCSTPITQHLVITAQTVLPTPPPSSPRDSASDVRYRHPPHLLKHRFKPFGARQGENLVNGGEMEVDPAPPPIAEPATQESQPTKAKRKGDGESPKKKPKRPRTSTVV